MDAFLLVEPYITGIISILGIFFIEAFVVASFKLYINQFLSPKTYHIMITLISGLIMTFFSIYFMMMSQKEDYYLIFGNLRMIIILIPIIFLNRNISLVSVILCSVFRLFYYGTTYRFARIHYYFFFFFSISGSDSVDCKTKPSVNFYL